TPAVHHDLSGVVFEVVQEGARFLDGLPCFSLRIRLEVAPKLLYEVDGEEGEVVDEVEGVLDLVGDPGCERAEARQLLLLNEPRLSGLEVGERTVELGGAPVHLPLQLLVTGLERLQNLLRILLGVRKGEVDMDDEPTPVATLENQ